VKPKPFITQAVNGDARYVRNIGTGQVWHKCHHRTLYADTDRSQVVYHANYLHYFEFGRASLMREVAYPYKEIEESGYVYPIIKVEIDYFRPLYYDDAMIIYTRPSRLERVRLQFDYVIVHEESGDLVCQGLTRHCAVNSKGTPVEVDPKTAQLWQSFPE
jgi:acyl-CoA thioester hydrolase